MEDERRQQPRCPVCAGSARLADDGEAIVCRMSLCKQNHLQVECPRCGLKEHQASNYQDKKYFFTCRDCQKTFSNSEP